MKYDYADGYTIQEQKQSGFTRKINDTIWKKAIEDEYNSSYKTLSNYYISQSITDENDYTGLFAGKNLIVIMMESVNNVALNPSYYPNLYKFEEYGVLVFLFFCAFLAEIVTVHLNLREVLPTL